MTKSCIVPNCKLTSKNLTRYKLSFRKIPNELNLRNQWISILKSHFDAKIIDKALEKKCCYVCDLHFPITCFYYSKLRKLTILYKGSVPSIFSDFKSCIEQTVEEKYKLLYELFNESSNNISKFKLVDDGSQADLNSIGIMDASNSLGVNQTMNNLEIEHPKTFNLQFDNENSIDAYKIQSTIENGPTDSLIIIYSLDETSNTVHTQCINYLTTKCNVNTVNNQFINTTASKISNSNSIDISTYKCISETACKGPELTNENKHLVDDDYCLSFDSNQLYYDNDLMNTVSSSTSLHKDGTQNVSNRNGYQANNFEDILKKSLIDVDIEDLDYKNEELLRRVIIKSQRDILKQQEQLAKYCRDINNLRKKIYKYQLKEKCARLNDQN